MAGRSAGGDPHRRRTVNVQPLSPAPEDEVTRASAIDVPALRGFRAVLAAILRRLPPRATASCGGAYGALRWLVDPRARRAARDRLGEALPEIDAAARRRLVRRSFPRLGSGLASELAAERCSPLELCRRLGFEGWENLNAATATGRGAVLLLTALGSWRVALRALVLYRPALSHALLSPPSQRDADPSAAMLASLSQGNEVAILLGLPPLDPTFAHLALASGAPAVLVVALPESRGRFRLRVSPPIEPAADDTLETLTRRTLQAIEDEIRRQPEVWPWSRQRWSA